MKVPSIVLLAFILVVGQTGFAEKITFDYLYSIPRPSSPQVSPDGRHVAFVLTEKDAQAGTSESHLWLMDSDGDNLKKLTNGPGSESSPRWSPDGKQVAFESSRSGQSQIWLLPIDGGEASQVTSLSTGAGGVVWASTGDRFVFVSEVYGGCESDSCNRERAREAADRELQARLYDHLMFRHYNHWDEGTFDQIFVADLSTRTVRNLFPSRFNVPAAWLGGWPDYAVSPDGLEVCFAMSRDPNPALCVNNDLFTVGIRGGEATQITDLEGLESLPSYSPDGKYLCYRQAARAGYESDQNDLVVISREDGTHSNLTETFDYSVSEVVWGAQSRHIYFTAINAGRSCVYRVDVKWGKIETLLDDAVYGDLAISPDSRFLIVNRSLPDVPYELFRFDFKKETLGRLTFFTDDVAGRLDLSPAEDFWFPGFNGDSVHGFLTRPPYMESDRKYPMVLLIHGGPQWCWLGDFNYYGWNTQLVAAQGYVVVQIDPHGSVGYGLRFKEYVSGNWGKGDFEDLMMGLDYVINTYPFVDSSRMAALGRSYGGFMANWICGHTDRFDCLVSIDGSCNQVSSYGTTEELWFPEWEFKGTPWENPEEYLRVSPLTYASEFKTPTMIIHGQMDYRVDISEGLQMFTTLQRMRIPSQLLYYPDEGHNARKVINLRYGYTKQFEWLRKWLQ